MSQSDDSMIEIEIDNFVSPNAANDMPDDEFVGLEMDLTPAMVAAETPAMVAETPAMVANPLGIDLAVVTGNTSGSLADGTMRGVGFNSAEGYVTALANGVKAATAESYKQTLQTAYQFTAEQIAALTVTLIPEGTDRPESVNPIVVTHEGPNAFQARRIAAGLTPNARMPAHPVTPAGNAPVAPTPDDNVILAPVAHAVETDEKQCGIELAWNPASRDGHEIARATVCALLDANDLSLFHPPIPMAKGLFGQVFKSLNNSEAREARMSETSDNDRLLARCVTRADFTDAMWPEDLVSRYVVGTIDATMELGSLGSKDLVCSLVKVGTGFECQFNGGTAAMRQAITERFEALQGESILNVTSLLKWYTGVLENRLGAVRDGFAMLIVDDGTDLAKERIATAETLAHALQGEDEYGPSPVMGRRLKINRVISRGGVTMNQFHMAVGAGLLNDVREHGKVFAKALLDAQTEARNAETARADATPESIEMAVRRAMIGSDRTNSKAIGLLATLKAIAARATAMVSAIGVHARPAIAACEALRAEYAPKCKGIDATSEMFANLELD